MQYLGKLKDQGILLCIHITTLVSVNYLNIRPDKMKVETSLLQRNMEFYALENYQRAS